MIDTSYLSAEMGVSGQIAHSRVLDGYERVAAACNASGKILGMGGVYDAETATRYIRLGARFVLTGSDRSYLLAGAGARSQTPVTA
jgi:2-keto-3-deoxy-L-rhamnonate aldolase RhmA